MTNNLSTGRERIEAAVESAGWTAHQDWTPLNWSYSKPNSKRQIRVYFGVRGQVIEAITNTASKTRHVLGRDKADQVIAFIAESGMPR